MKGEFWKLFFMWGAKWLTFGKEVFQLGTKGRGKLIKSTIKWTSYKLAFKNFLNTLRVLLLTSSGSLMYHTNNSYFWICLQTFSWRIQHYITLKFRDTFGKLLQSITFLNMLFFHRYFSAMLLRASPKEFGSFSKFFQCISRSHSIPWNFMYAFVLQIKAVDI